LLGLGPLDAPLQVLCRGKSDDAFDVEHEHRTTTRILPLDRLAEENHEPSEQADNGQGKPHWRAAARYGVSAIRCSAPKPPNKMVPGSHCLVRYLGGSPAHTSPLTGLFQLQPRSCRLGAEACRTF